MQKDPVNRLAGKLALITSDERGLNLSHTAALNGVPGTSLLAAFTQGHTGHILMADNGLSMMRC